MPLFYDDHNFRRVPLPPQIEKAVVRNGHLKGIPYPIKAPEDPYLVELGAYHWDHELIVPYINLENWKRVRDSFVDDVPDTEGYSWMATDEDAALMCKDLGVEELPKSYDGIELIAGYPHTHFDDRLSNDHWHPRHWGHPEGWPSEEEETP